MILACTGCNAIHRDSVRLYSALSVEVSSDHTVTYYDQHFVSK